MKSWFAVAAAAAVVASTALPAQAEKTLRLTLQLPIQHPLGENVTAFKAEVERGTAGSVKVEIYPASQLYKDNEVPQAVSSGAVEMGVASLAQFAGTIPAVDVFYVPFMFPTVDSVNKATAPGSAVRAPLDAAIEKTGTKVLWWQAYGGAVFLSKKAPILLPSDLKDKKVRIFSKTLGDLVNLAGGAPVTVSGSEQFLAYQRGTVDVGMSGITAVEDRKMYQVMDQISMTNLVDIEFVVLINPKAYQGLSDKEREVVNAAALKVEKDLRTKFTDLEAKAAAFVKTKVNVVELNAQQIEAWKKVAEPIVDKFAAGAGDLGKQVVAAARNLK